MGDNPDIQWALDILTPDPDYKPSLLTEYGLLATIPSTLFLGACYRNRALYRPAFAGLQVHILMTLVGIVAAYKIKDLTNDHFARRDNMLRHYVTLHPEDFPQPERKKWSEVLEPWYPIR